MTYAALIPFVILLISFVSLRLPLHQSAMIALLSGTLLTGTVFHGTSDIWNASIIKTAEFLFEIGFILFGAFFFLESAKKSGVLDSLVALIRKISPNRVIQGVLVTFPLELMIEGSSGFGTPLLVITPILVTLGFDLSLCIVLPLLSCVIGIPFGALGTPTRLGFPHSNPSHEIAILLSPFTLIAPMITQYLISKKLKWRESTWILLLAIIYSSASYFASKSGPEFTALIPAFLTSVFGLFTANFFFSHHHSNPWNEKRGLFTYAALILFLWLGKQIFMDQLIPGTHVRIFNPGYLFVFFGILISLPTKNLTLGNLFVDTIERSKKTLLVFFCMTFIVQQMRLNGALELLSSGLPSLLKEEGAPLIGWLGSSLVGTSTMANLLLSKVVDPVYHAALGAGSALGVPLAFQVISALRALIHEKLTEKEIFLKLAPWSLLFVLLLVSWQKLIV